MPWAPGQSGNPRGRPPRDPLDRELERLEAAIAGIDRAISNRFTAALLVNDGDHARALGSLDRDAISNDEKARDRLIAETRHVRRAVDALRRAEAELAVVPAPPEQKPHRGEGRARAKRERDRLLVELGAHIERACGHDEELPH